MGKKLTEDFHKSYGSHKKALRKTLRDYVLTSRDIEMLAVCGLTDDDTIDKAGGAVLLAIKTYYEQQMQLRDLDKQLTGGIVGGVMWGIARTVMVWRFARDTKNRYNQNKFSTVCDSKAGTSHCSVCMHMFKFWTWRVEYRKYHCRCCGRVVCFTCSGNKVFFAATQTHERICTECIHTGGPPADRVYVYDDGESAKNAMKAQAVNTTALVAKSVVADVKVSFVCLLYAWIVIEWLCFCCSEICGYRHL